MKELLCDSGCLNKQKREGFKMKNKLTKIVAILVVIGLTGAGSLAYAQNKGDNQGESKGYKHRGPDEFFKELNLTAEQKEKLKAQREAKKGDFKALHEQMKAKMQALHEEISKPGTTRADVNGLVNEINALKGQMFSQMTDGIFAMKEVLTPEQFAKMQAKHQERMNKKGKEWGKHGGWEKPSEEPEPDQE